MEHLELGLFEQAGEAARMLVSDRLGPMRFSWHRRGVKIWFDSEDCPKEHYEAQTIGRNHVDGLTGVAIEIGFHTEHREESDNQFIIDSLMAKKSTWVGDLGDEAIPGAFYGNHGWRRLSEAWIEPDIETDDELGFELGSRLADYVLALEPLVKPLRR
ncbi:MAG: hypothetical protein ACKVHU_17345 [Acidimicrobiales bacterium]|jgi:hypothetical protein